MKGAFLHRSLQNWILSIFQNMYQARNQKMVFLICIALIILLLFLTICIFFPEKCLPVRIFHFLIGLVFYYLFVELLYLLLN